MKARITKRAVEAIKPASKDQFLWDTEVKGLGCKVTPKGRRSYLLQTYIKGRLRRMTLGTHGAITAEQARKEAIRLLAEVSAGNDPASERRDSRNACTLSEIAERYLVEHAEAHKKPRSVQEDRSNLNSHVLPALGNRRIDAITHSDVAKLHQKMRKTPYAANRSLALLSVIFNLSERWGLRPGGSNPCRHITKYKEEKRERYLSELELRRLGKVLAEAERTRTENPAVIAAIRLLVFTGARLSEILTLRWEYVDFDRSCLQLPDSKTGAKTILLNAPARAAIEAIYREDSPWVIEGAHHGSHLVNIQKPWRRIRKRAKIEDVHIHDLRHTFASFGAGSNLGLPVIGGLLGHREAATTQRYAHLADDPLRKASETIGSQIAEAMERTDPKLKRVK